MALQVKKSCGTHKKNRSSAGICVGCNVGALIFRIGFGGIVY